MKIKLVQTGGFIPVTKEAVTDVDWTKEECENIISRIAVTGNESSAVRDGIDHIIEIDNEETLVNLAKVPGKYAAVFDHLRKDLKIVKT